MTEIDESPMNIKNPLNPDNEQLDFSTNKHVKLSGIRDSNVSTVKNSGSFSHRLHYNGNNKFTLKMHDQLHP